MICAIAACALLLGVYVNDSIKPKHRGEDLTIAQIAQNHNFEVVDEFVRSITYEQTWATKSENCTYTGGYFFAENEGLPSSVTLKIEINIHDIP